MENILFDLPSHPWACWTLLALLFGILEVTLPAFAFSFASIAAALAALVSLQFGVTLQAVSFAVTTLLALFLLRPYLLKKFRPGVPMPSRADALIGAQGQVTEPLDIATLSGRVLVNGQDWAARSEAPLVRGQNIIVQHHDGIVLIVKEI